MPGGPWRLRVAVVLALVACHAALFYGIARTRATRSSGTGEGPMFGPVISRVWQPPRGSVLAARPPAPSEFTPVTEARAGLPDAGAARRRQKLRMVRWLRPAYPAELAARRRRLGVA